MNFGKYCTDLILGKNVLYIYLLSFLRFKTFCIEWFSFFIFHCVTMQTENIPTLQVNPGCERNYIIENYFRLGFDSLRFFCISCYFPLLL